MSMNCILLTYSVSWYIVLYTYYILSKLIYCISYLLHTQWVDILYYILATYSVSWYIVLYTSYRISKHAFYMLESIWFKYSYFNLRGPMLINIWMRFVSNERWKSFTFSTNIAWIYSKIMSVHQVISFFFVQFISSFITFSSCTIFSLFFVLILLLLMIFSIQWVELVQRSRLLTLISVDGVQFPPKATVFLQSP